MAFNPGDKVQRVGNSWHECKKGDIVTVVLDNTYNLTCKEHPEHVFNSASFVLANVEAVPVPSQFNIGDKVVRMPQHTNGMWPTTDMVYTVAEKRVAVNDVGIKTYKIRVMGKEGFWFADKFALSEAKAPLAVDVAVPQEFAPGVYVTINKIVYTTGLEAEKRAKWEGAVIQLRKKYDGTKWHPEKRPDLDMSIHNWIDQRDCTVVTAPTGAAPAYVPPPARKIKVYNAERKSNATTA